MLNNQTTHSNSHTGRTSLLRVESPKNIGKLFHQKSIMILKENSNSFRLVINNKLPQKLNIVDTTQVALFPEANCIMLCTKLPFSNARGVSFYDMGAKICTDTTLAEQIVSSFNLDFDDCTALVFRKIAFQEVSGSCMATIFLEE